MNSIRVIHPYKKMFIEVDCREICTAHFSPVEDLTETTPVYNNPKNEKIAKWRDIRLGFIRSSRWRHRDQRRVEKTISLYAIHVE